MIAIVVLLAPGVAAAPVYDILSPGVTSEDDGAVIVAPNTFFDGRANRVVYPGASPGDGGLFLDARVASAVAGIDLYAGPVSELAFGHSKLLVPGFLQGFAWYGWWRDAEVDGRIADFHDTRCAPACAADEFLWRGAATGESIGMMLFTIPRTLGGISGGGSQADAESYGIVRFADATDTDRETQEWSTDFNVLMTLYLDASTLASIQTVVIAGARQTQAEGMFDFDDPAGLHDVDRYDALSPDVAALWTSVLDTKVTPPALPPVGEDLPPPKFIPAYVVAIALEAAAPVLEQLPSAPSPDEDPNDASRRAANEAMMTPYAKEPNHESDDYEGRAVYGGVGDYEGSYNTYAAYKDRYHFYVDAQSRSRACAGASAPVPGTPVTVAVSAICPSVTPAIPRALDSLGGLRGGARSTGYLLAFDASPLMWHDLNGDTHLGSVCDPDTEAFDAERNTCRADAGHPNYPQSYSAASAWELSYVCATTERDDIRLAPIGGTWPDVIIIRDYSEAGRSGGDAIEVRSDDAPITLRWHAECRGIGSRLETRDAIVFPTGSPIAIRVESTYRIPAFKDVSLGIDVTAEYVRDVDVLAATL